MSSWVQNNARLHALAGELHHPDGAHGLLKQLAADVYGAVSLRDLTQVQQLALIKRLEGEVAASAGLAAIATPRATKAQVRAIKATAERGLGWDTARLHRDLDVVYGHHVVKDLSPSEANKYIQRLNQIKRNGGGAQI